MKYLKIRKKGSEEFEYGLVSVTESFYLMGNKAAPDYPYVTKIMCLTEHVFYSQELKTRTKPTFNQLQDAMLEYNYLIEEVDLEFNLKTISEASLDSTDKLLELYCLTIGEFSIQKKGKYLNDDQSKLLEEFCRFMLSKRSNEQQGSPNWSTTIYQDSFGKND